MEIFIAIGSIFALTLAVFLANRVLRIAICPICAGVAGTWAWMLVGMLAGALPTSRFQLPTSLLMGGSVVGIAYQLEKQLPVGRSPLLWKSLAMPIGFIVPYALLLRRWPLLAAALAAFAAIIGIFFMPRTRAPGTAEKKAVEDLERKMKQCC